MIKELFNSGSMPVLERLTQFTAARHNLIAHNIANLSTPHFRPRDLSVTKFQGQLRKAVDERRDSANSVNGPLNIHGNREVRFERDGLKTQPQPLDENIMFHDRNNRDLERVMQDLAENTLTHNTSIELLRNQFDLLKTAIRERI